MHVKKWRKVMWVKNLKHLTKIKVGKKFEGIQENRKHVNKIHVLQVKKARRYAKKKGK